MNVVLIAASATRRPLVKKDWIEEFGPRYGIKYPE